MTGKNSTKRRLRLPILSICSCSLTPWLQKHFWRYSEKKLISQVLELNQDIASPSSPPDVADNARMATRPAVKPLLKLCSRSIASQFSVKTQRTLTTRSAPSFFFRLSSPLLKPSILRTSLQQSFRRSYADASSPTAKRRSRGILRWTWRLIYLSTLGGLVYLGYTIYDGQTPTEQIEAGPNKKTLVILGLSKSV